MSVMWNRIYGKEKFANLYDRYFACQQLKMTLELTGCKRLVIGHTPQVRAVPAVSESLSTVRPSGRAVPAVCWFWLGASCCSLAESPSCISTCISS